MKRILPWLFALALLSLSACAPESKPSNAPPEEDETIQLESLAVEVSRGELSTEDLAQAVRELPEALKEALAAQGVEAETVTVSVGSSPEATVQAVQEGGVDAAFFPQEDLWSLEETVKPFPLLYAGPTSGDGQPDPDAMVAIVHWGDDERLHSEAFATALAAAVNSLREEEPVFGPYDYAWVDTEPEEESA